MFHEGCSITPNRRQCTMRKHKQPAAVLKQQWAIHWSKRAKGRIQNPGRKVDWDAKEAGCGECKDGSCTVAGRGRSPEMAVSDWTWGVCRYACSCFSRAPLASASPKNRERARRWQRCSAKICQGLRDLNPGQLHLRHSERP